MDKQQVAITPASSGLPSCCFALTWQALCTHLSPLQSWATSLPPKKLALLAAETVLESASVILMFCGFEVLPWLVATSPRQLRRPYCQRPSFFFLHQPMAHRLEEARTLTAPGARWSCMGAAGARTRCATSAATCRQARCACSSPLASVSTPPSTLSYPTGTAARESGWTPRCTPGPLHLNFVTYVLWVLAVAGCAGLTP